MPRPLPRARDRVEELHLAATRDNQEAVERIPFAAPPKSFKNVDVPATPDTVAIAHGFGRSPDGWMLTKVRGNATIWQSTDDERFLRLSASAAVTVDVLVW